MKAIDLPVGELELFDEWRTRFWTEQDDLFQLHALVSGRFTLRQLDSNHRSTPALVMPRRAIGTAGPDITLLVKLDLAGEGDPRRHWNLDQPLSLRIEAPDRVIACAADPDDAQLLRS